MNVKNNKSCITNSFSVEIILILLSFFSFTYANGQGSAISQYIPPSPDASALAKYANIPVNLYTGTPSITVPLYDLPFRGGSVPVFLSYHASGIKVQDIASSCGLGWSLSAGGLITRIVRGLPDEDENGYCGRNKTGNRVTDRPQINYLTDILERRTDAEPDIFMII